MAKGRGSGGSYRSAISGRYVTAKHGKASSRTTLREARGGGSTGSHRSAVTGRFVTAKYGKAHPRTTVKESSVSGIPGRASQKSRPGFPVMTCIIGEGKIQTMEQHFPPVAQRFFFLYSRLEFALKKQRMVNRDASANWDQFARHLGRAFFNEVVESGVAAYLIAHPPRKQIVLEGKVLDWEEPHAVSNAASLFGAIRTARNNLFHGGKFRYGYVAGSERDERLLTDCIAVLEAALRFDEPVAQTFRAAGCENVLATRKMAAAGH